MKCGAQCPSGGRLQPDVPAHSEIFNYVVANLTASVVEWSRPGKSGRLAKGHIQLGSTRWIGPGCHCNQKGGTVLTQSIPSFHHVLAAIFSKHIVDLKQGVLLRVGDLQWEASYLCSG